MATCSEKMCIRKNGVNANEVQWLHKRADVYVMQRGILLGFFFFFALVSVRLKIFLHLIWRCHNQLCVSRKYFFYTLLRRLQGYHSGLLQRLLRAPLPHSFYTFSLSVTNSAYMQLKWEKRWRVIHIADPTVILAETLLDKMLPRLWPMLMNIWKNP